jgi:cysteine-rich repeat protein
MTAGGLLTLAQATVNSSLDIDQEVTLGDLDSTTVTVSGTATMPGLVTTGDASVGGDATITGELDVTGPVTFHGHVVFEGGASAGDDTPSPKYLLAEDEDRDVEFLGGAEIAGGISLGGDLDLQFNQLLNARFPVADAAPAGCGPEASGYVYLNTSLDSLMLCSGGEYVQLGGVWECGNANVEPLEGCDDSNAVPGDGCSATCMVEHGWICDPTTVQPTSCNTLCGDGKKASVEPCDDGNDGELDGCRNDCSVMPGWTCAGVEPSVCGATECGDGIWAGDEACDDGDQNDNNGCRNDCTIMDGWECENVHGQASQCEPPCGDGTLGQNEQCDDGDKDNGDGCSANCAIEAGYVCLHSPMPSKCWKNTCGDGKRYTNEECDDDDTSGGDGCSSGCQIEQWWNCSGSLGQKSQCQAICGDSHVVGGQEECDDGNGSGGDGCNGSCNEEDGWNCSGAGPGTCSPICGDGKKKGNEQCDDGDGYSGDGCSSLCQQENGWTCNSPTNHSPFGVPVGPGSVCSAGCGNMNMGSEITAVMFDSKCYWVFKRNTNFKQAAFQCATMNGVLASPKSQLAQDALTQALGGQNGWLGFHQQTWNSGAGTDNGGAWTDGKGIYAGEGNHAGSWNFQLWNEMPPGNYGPDDCSWTQNGTWYSGHCTNTTRYVTCQSK